MKYPLPAGSLQVPLGIPMPGLHKQIGVLAVTDDAPSGRENLLDLIGTKEHVGGVAGHAVDGRTQGIERAECVYDVAGSGVDENGLRCSLLRRRRAQRPEG